MPYFAVDGDCDKAAELHDPLGRPGRMEPCLRA
jgi:hypothetical protein